MAFFPKMLLFLKKQERAATLMRPPDVIRPLGDNLTTPEVALIPPPVVAQTLCTFKDRAPKEQ